METDMAQDARSLSDTAVGAINSGWLSFGSLMAGCLGARRPGEIDAQGGGATGGDATGGRFGRWLFGPRPAPHRDVDGLSARERRDIGVSRSGPSSPPPTHEVVTGLTLRTLGRR
jgi:hypothetical protein